MFETFLSTLSKTGMQLQKKVVLSLVRHLCAMQRNTKRIHHLTWAVLAQVCAPLSDPRYLCESPRQGATRP